MASEQVPTKRLTGVDIAKRKGGPKVVAQVAYHSSVAKIIDRHCDFILVGDSLGMNLLGMDTTVPVTLESMIPAGTGGCPVDPERLGGGGYAIRLLSGVTRASIPERRPGDERDRGGRGENGRRRPHGRDRRLSCPAGHSGHGAYWSDTPGRERDGWFPRSRKIGRGRRRIDGRRSGHCRRRRICDCDRRCRGTGCAPPSRRTFRL